MSGSRSENLSRTPYARADRSGARWPSPTPTAGRSRPTDPDPPALTLTLSIPLAGGQELTAPARRLLDVVRELVEQGQLTSTVLEDAGEPAHVLAPVPAPRRPRRTRPTEPVPDPGVGLHILATSRVVRYAGVPLTLTRLEFDLLMHLASHPRRVFTRLQLLAAVWGYEHTGVRTVDVHVRRLRGKVGTDVPLVTTVYGVGYRLAEEAQVVVDRAG